MISLSREKLMKKQYIYHRALTLVKVINVRAAQCKTTRFRWIQTYEKWNLWPLKFDFLFWPLNFDFEHWPLNFDLWTLTFDLWPDSSSETDLTIYFSYVCVQRGWMVLYCAARIFMISTSVNVLCYTCYFHLLCSPSLNPVYFFHQ